MTKSERDYCLDTLLDLDGQTYFIDPKHWVKFEVKRVPVTPQKPHGLDYSLTLHDKDGERLVGFDNAHAVQTSGGPGKRKPIAYDHKHRFKTIKPYEYKNAEQLLEDFWTVVDEVLEERGVKT